MEEKKQSIISQIREGLADACYIWVKEMRTAFTDEGVLIFFILVPLLYPLLYSWAYTNETVREVPVAIVDLSHSQKSREFIRAFDAAPDVKAAYYCNNLQEAKNLTAKQVVRGTIYIPSDFEKNIYRGETATVSVYCDMALMLTYKAIYQTAQAVASQMGSEIQTPQSGGVTNEDDKINAQPLAFEEVPIFNATGGYGNSLIPAVLILILQQTLLLGIGLSAGTARENNRYKDLVPISRHYNGLFRIVIGKSACYFMIYAVMAAYITLVVPRFFRYTALAQPIPLFAILIPYLLACIFFGMTLSCLVRYRENVILLVVFTSVPFLFVTGASWPQSNIPGFWQGVSWVIPSTFGVRAFLRLNSMGASLDDVQPEFQALWLQALVYFLLTCVVYRLEIRNTRKKVIDRMERLRKGAQKEKEKRLQTQENNA